MDFDKPDFITDARAKEEGLHIFRPDHEKKAPKLPPLNRNAVIIRLYRMGYGLFRIAKFFRFKSRTPIIAILKRFGVR